MSDLIIPAVAVSLPNVGGIVGGFVTRNNLKDWFESLKKPSWRPPNYLFGPVWTALYCSMGYASYMVWRDGGGFAGKAALPLAWYGGQLALNWSWSFTFFGAQSPKAGLVTIVCMWGGIVGTIYNFYAINRTAAYLLLPYLGWVSFATALNYRIWKDNPDTKDK